MRAMYVPVHTYTYTRAYSNVPRIRMIESKSPATQVNQVLEIGPCHTLGQSCSSMAPIPITGRCEVGSRTLSRYITAHFEFFCGKRVSARTCHFAVSPSPPPPPTPPYSLEFEANIQVSSSARASVASFQAARVEKLAARGPSFSGEWLPLRARASWWRPPRGHLWGDGSRPARRLPVAPHFPPGALGRVPRVSINLASYARLPRRCPRPL